MGDNERNRSFDVLTKKWALLVIVCASPIYVLFAFLGDPGRGIAAYGSAAMIAFIVRYFWDLRKRVWFWVTIALLVFLHAFLIMVFQFPDERWNHIQALPFALLDFGIAYGFVRLVENIARRIRGWRQKRVSSMQNVETWLAGGPHK